MRHHKGIFLALLMSITAVSVAEDDLLPSVGCIIEPSVRIDVSSPVEGILRQLPVAMGQSVKKGQTLFSLRSDVERAAVGLAKIRAEFALRHYERNEGLYQDELISIHERDEFQTEHQLALKELQQTRAVLALRTVHSPIDGVVIERFIEPGEFVTTAPVLALASLDPLKVEVIMPYRTLGSVTQSDQLMVFPVEPVGGAHEARISMVDPIIDAASGTYRVHAFIDNPEGKLPAGIECKVALTK